MPARHLRWLVTPLAPAARPVTQLALGATTASSLGDCLPSLPRGSQPAPRGGLSRRRPVLCDTSKSYDTCILVNFEKYLLLGGPAGCSVCIHVRTLSRGEHRSKKGCIEGGIALTDNYCGTPHYADFLLQCPPITSMPPRISRYMYFREPLHIKLGISSTNTAHGCHKSSRYHAPHGIQSNFFSQSHLMLGSTLTKPELIFEVISSIFGGVGTCQWCKVARSGG